MIVVKHFYNKNGKNSILIIIGKYKKLHFRFHILLFKIVIDFIH